MEATVTAASMTELVARGEAEPTYENLTDLILAYRERVAEVERMERKGGASRRSAHAQNSRLDREMSRVALAAGAIRNATYHAYAAAAISTYADEMRFGAR